MIDPILITAILAVNFLGGGAVGYLLGGVGEHPLRVPARSVIFSTLLYVITVGCSILNILIMQAIKP